MNNIDVYSKLLNDLDLRSVKRKAMDLQREILSIVYDSFKSYSKFVKIEYEEGFHKHADLSKPTKCNL